MGTALFSLLAFGIGSVGTFFVMYWPRRKAIEEARRYQRKAAEIEDEWDRVNAKQRSLRDRADDLEAAGREHNRQSGALSSARTSHDRLVADFMARQREWELAVARAGEHWNAKVKAVEAEQQRREQELARREASFDRQVISYDQLAHENGLIKAELSNFTIHAAYLEHLHETDQAGRSSAADQRDALGRLYFELMKETVVKGVTASNLPQSNQKVRTVAERVRGAGVPLAPTDEQRALAVVYTQFEKAVKAQAEREEQARLKEQYREEQKRVREIAEAEEAARVAELERERAAAELERARAEVARETAELQVRLERSRADTALETAEATAEALAEAAGRHAVELATLQARLAAAELKSERTKSNAELMKKGCVYVISNRGSFGDGVFKIGMTRRSNPLDRVKELGDASVPFPFDVHMKIQCEDAPALENALHKAFHHRRLNRVNLRKEFFRVPVADIAAVVERLHGKVEYTADAEALEFVNSQTATDDDLGEIDAAFATAGAGTEPD